MKTIGHKFILILFISLSSNVFAKETLTFSSVNYCPWICDNQKLPGIMVEIARKVFEKHKIAVKVKFASFEKAIVMANSGLSDGLIAGNKEQAPKLIFPNKVAIYQYVKFFKRKGESWVYKNIDSLKKIKIGAVQDYSMADKTLDNYISSSESVSKVSQAQGTPHLIRLLGHKRIDAFPDGHLSAKYHISNAGFTGQNIETPGSIGRFSNYISFSPKLKNAQKYVKIMDKEIAQLRKNGFYQAILKKYGITDSQF